MTICYRGNNNNKPRTLCDKENENNDKNSKLNLLNKTRSKSLADGIDKNEPIVPEGSGGQKHELKFRERCSKTIDRFWNRGRIRTNTFSTILPNNDKSIVITNDQQRNSKEEDLVIIDESSLDSSLNLNDCVSRTRSKGK